MLLASLACVACDGGGPSDAAARLGELGRPGGLAGENLLLVTFDTLRVDRIGCYGASGGATPHIDALAARGLRFAAYAPAAPQTLPSHASLLTGLDPPRHGARANGGFELADDRTTLAEVLSDAGYDTAAFVSAFVLDARYGVAQGFGHYDDTMTTAAGRDAGTTAERRAGEVTDAALAWIDARLDADPGRPFFAWVHYYDPHLPHRAPEPFASRMRDPYDAEVAYADAELGRLLARLDERGVAGRTLVVFATDHGESLGEHDEEGHGNLLYETTMHAALVLSHPRLFASPMVVDDRVAASVDVVPTVLNLLGVPYDAIRFDGIDLLTAGRDPDRAVYIETLAPLVDYGWSSLHGLRRRDDKFILAPRPEYYALDDDPGETANLYGRAEAARELQEELALRMADWPSALEAAAGRHELDAEQSAHLAALGYVSASAAGEALGVKDPKDMMVVRRRIGEAKVLSQQGRHDEAVQAIRAVLEVDETDATAWYAAYDVHRRANQPVRAMKALRRALELNPRADAWVYMAGMLLASGDEEGFGAALDEAERLDPEEPMLHVARGEQHARAGDLESALRSFERALAADPLAGTAAIARERIAQTRVQLDAGAGGRGASDG